MSNTYQATVLDFDKVDVPGTPPRHYYRVRMQVDPADIATIKQAVNQITVHGTDANGQSITFKGLVQVEDEANGIIVGNFNQKP